MLGVYAKIMKEDLALPVVEGVKSAGERFPGALDTYTCETMVSDTKALQAGTSHFLGQNFAKAFEIQFQDANGEQQFAWTTSWGVSTRMIGAVIMTHSDDDGLILPPRIAPTKVVIVPISKDDAKFAEMAAKAHELADELCKVLGPLTVKVDEQNHMRPADRFFWHLQKGVPLRLELGEKDAANEAVRSVRRDTGAKEDIKWSELSEKVPAILDDIQKSLYEKACAFRDANTYEVDSYEALKAQLAKGGWVKCFFAGSIEDEKKIKEETQATVRCYPLAEKDRTGKCVYTGKEGARMTAHLLKEALRKYLAEQDRVKMKRASKAQTKKVEKPKTYRGRQTVKQLMTQNTKLTNIEVTDQNIKSFERVAKKYNIDFALKKDKSIEPPRYMVFFKARDVDVMHAAFKEYSAKELNKSKKPSLRKNLEQSKEKAKQMERMKVKQKDRGRDR